MILKALSTLVVLVMTGLVATGQDGRQDASAQDSSSISRDTIPVGDSTRLTSGKSEIETTIVYSARDSITAGVNSQIVILYGDASVTYGDISLEADRLIIDYRNHTITATYGTDSLGGDTGYPTFKEGAQLYETKGIVYNYVTRRAKIREIVTRQGESVLKSGLAFKTTDDNILSFDNAYTTCGLEHAHFEIMAKKAKAIKDDKIVTGPFYMKLNGVPLPIGFLFGIFPSQQTSSSGIIVPSYGEEQSRGFNLRGGGYFFDINEYFKASVTGDIYSNGSHALYMNTSYSVRYRYNGAFNFAYSKNYTSTDIEDRSAVNDYRVSWSHSPLSRGNSRFSASVDAATSTYNENNNLTQPTTELYSSSLNNTTAILNSTIGYSKQFVGLPVGIGTNLSFTKNLVTNEVNIRFPSLNLTLRNQYPFQEKRNLALLNNVSISYTMGANSHITNNIGDPDRDGKDSIATFNVDNLSMFLANSKRGIKHAIPISNSFDFLRYFMLSQSINYEEKWYFESLDWTYSNNGFKSDTVPGFNRIANYSFSFGLTTKLFGMYLMKNKERKVKAIRHVVNPNIAFTYTPDFTDNKAYFQHLVDDQGNTVVRSRHEGFLYGPSLASESASISFGVSNNLEMKFKSPADTTERKVMLLNNLSFNTSYNFLADAFKLAPISIAANTNILKDKVNANIRGTLDPYRYQTIADTEGNSVETRTNIYSWKYGGVGRITSAALALNANLNPEKQKSDNETREAVAKSDASDPVKQHLMQHQPAYVDFSIPWSLNIGYNLAYSHQVNTRPSVTQTLQMSGDLSLSKLWKVTYNTGYDFRHQAFTQTSFGVSRDLHCWIMNFDWVPFGKFQSYYVTIAVKASILRDAKVEKRRSFTDQ